MVDVNNYKESYRKFEESLKVNQQFSNNYDASKVIDLGQTNLIKKRPRVEMATDETNNLELNKKLKEELKTQENNENKH